MVFYMSNAGITSNNVYCQTKNVLSQSVNNNPQGNKKLKFVLKNKPSFSTSSANKNINYSKSKITTND